MTHSLHTCQSAAMPCGRPSLLWRWQTPPSFFHDACLFFARPSPTRQSALSHHAPRAETFFPIRRRPGISTWPDRLAHTWGLHPHKPPLTARGRRFFARFDSFMRPGSSFSLFRFLCCSDHVPRQARAAMVRSPPFLGSFALEFAALSLLSGAAFFLHRVGYAIDPSGHPRQ